MDYLEERNIGVRFGGSTIPLVPAAILFDLRIGDGKVRPGRECGYAAAKSASHAAVAEGNVGAGAGATVGRMLRRHTAGGMKGGLGTASLRAGRGRRRPTRRRSRGRGRRPGAGRRGTGRRGGRRTRPPACSSPGCRPRGPRTRPRSRKRSGERTLSASWLPHSAATNSSFLVTCRPIGAIGKFVKAECLHQHAASVRSPESREYAATIHRASASIFLSRRFQ